MRLRELLKVVAVGFVSASVLVSCGGGGMKEGPGYATDGFDYFDGSYVNTGRYKVVRYEEVRDENGNFLYIRNIEVPPSSEDDPIVLRITREHEGPTALKAWITGLSLSWSDETGGYEKIKIPYTREIKPGETVDVPFRVPAVVKRRRLPFILGNDLLSYYMGENAKSEIPPKSLIRIKIANRDELWKREEKSLTYTGGSYQLTDLGVISNVKVSFDNQTCEISGNRFLPPCNGTVDFENGVIDVSIDSSYLSNNHEKEVDVSEPDYSFLLSQGVKAGSVRISGSGYSLVDDGNGNLVGKGGNGTIDYETGQVVLHLNLPTDTVEEQVHKMVGYTAAVEVYNLGQKVKPLTFVAKLYNSTDIENAEFIVCSDDGNGALVGGCSGDIDYETGNVTIEWDKEGKVETFDYTLIKEGYKTIPLTVEWQTLDKDLNLTVGYDKAINPTGKVFYLKAYNFCKKDDGCSIDPNSIRIYDNGVDITDKAEIESPLDPIFSPYTAKITLSEYPKGDLYATVLVHYPLEGLFGYVPFIYSPSSVYEDSLTATVYIKREDGEIFEVGLAIPSTEFYTEKKVVVEGTNSTTSE